MKIGFDAKRAFNNKSGLGSYSRDVIRAVLDKNQDDIFLFTPQQNKAIFQPKEVTVIEPQEGIDSLIKAYWRSFSIVKEVDKLQLDIFHGLSNELPFTVGKPVKTVVTIHDLIFKRFPEWYKAFDRRMYDWKFKSACQNSDKIIAISQQTKADIIEFYGIEDRKIEVVYQTCNDRFKTKATAEQITKVKAKYHLPEDFLLNVGTIEPRKNALNIVKAIHRNNIETPLYIIGRNTKYVEEIKAFISENKFNTEIKILHEVSNEELPVFYQLAKIFIYPSTFEGFGIPIIESLYSGTPVITSKGSCFAEPGGDHSIYTEVGNIEVLAEAISTLIADTDQCKKMAEEGLKYVQKFNTDKVTTDLYRVYHQLTK